MLKLLKKNNEWKKHTLLYRHNSNYYHIAIKLYKKKWNKKNIKCIEKTSEVTISLFLLPRSETYVNVAILNIKLT